MSDIDDTDRKNYVNRAGDGIHYFQSNQPVPEGSRIISVQMDERSDGLKKVIGYWYQIPTENLLQEAIKIIKKGMKSGDEDYRWCGPAKEFVMKHEFV